MEDLKSLNTRRRNGWRGSDSASVARRWFVVGLGALGVGCWRGSSVAWRRAGSGSWARVVAGSGPVVARARALRWHRARGAARRLGARARLQSAGGSGVALGELQAQVRRAMRGWGGPARALLGAWRGLASGRGL